jgi:sugar phosphate isomerase/epimerase
VNVAFENLRRLGYLKYILSHVDSPRAGFCYDSGHHNCRTPNEDLLSQYGSRLMALHLHDNDGSDDQHRLPFDGTTDWSATMRRIAQSGYKGALALEATNNGHVNGLRRNFYIRLLNGRRDLKHY